MIAINDYRQFFAELVAAASRESGVEVSKTRLAVTETQLINLLKDQKGVVVAGNIPGFDITYGSCWLSRGECIVYVLEKMPGDYQGTDREYERYADLQRLMAARRYSSSATRASWTSRRASAWSGSTTPSAASTASRPRST